MLLGSCVRSARRMSSGRAVRIGCASGFWGDTAAATPQLLGGGRLQYLVFDYLSEITMSLLAAARVRDPQLGYAPDFLQVLLPRLAELRAGGVRVLSNAGGVNPTACADALRAAADQQGVPLRVAAVTGDDLRTDRRLQLPDGTVSVNAYLGAGALVRALQLGADVVVTGRCVDSALVLAPLVHEFDWHWSQWDQLAAGSLAGHLLECGAQSTGGVFTDWRRVQADWHRIGFPVAECRSDGSFLLTKPPDTGGLLSAPSVAEQLLYELDDPRRYRLPDVCCDFTRVRLTEETAGVRVEGARGRPPGPSYKVSGTRRDGYRATAVCPVIGPDADEKAHCTARAILARCRLMLAERGLADFSSVHVQALGAEEMYGPGERRAGGSCREAVLWLAVHHADRRAVELFGREVAPAGTGMAPGLTGLVGGRPKPSPVLRLFSFLHQKHAVPVQIHVDGELRDTYKAPVSEEAAAEDESCEDSESSAAFSGPCSYRLHQLAYTRSGDKADVCNIGVIARRPEFYPLLKRALTTSAVAEYMAHLLEPGADGTTEVLRYLLPGTQAMNFVLPRALGGGGVASLRPDPQGKSYGQLLLDLQLHGLPELHQVQSQSCQAGTGNSQPTG